MSQPKEAMEQPPKLMTLREVADYLRLNAQTVYRLAQAGNIPGFKLGGTWRFDRDRIDTWIAEREQRPGSPGASGTSVTAPHAAGGLPALILVVEDEELLREMLLTALQEEGYRVVGAANGREALAALEAEVPALIMLDIRLPDIDGLEILRRSRADPRTTRVPVVFLTGRAEPAEKLEAIRLGGDDYLVKPVSLEEIQARVAMHLRRSERERM